MAVWHGRYILDEHGEPQLCDDLLTWAKWFERTTNDRTRIVAHDRDEGPNGVEVLVSTVFLGLDHSFGHGPPLLWETMVMGGLLNGECDRYASRDAAFRGHQEMCRRVSETLHRP